MSLNLCGQCKAVGLPIMPLRYVVVPKDVTPALPDWAKAAGMCPMSGEYHYALRTLRGGYAYIFYPKGEWECYCVTVDGYFIKQESPLRAMPPGGAVHCSRHGSSNARLSYLVIEHPQKVDKAWLAFSEHKWSKETLAAYAQDASLRDKRMFLIEPAKLMEKVDGSRLTKPTVEALQGVIEYAANNSIQNLPDTAVAAPVSTGEDGNYSAKRLQMQFTEYRWYLRENKAQEDIQSMADRGRKADGTAHSGVVVALWDAIGMAHELNGYRSDVVARLRDYSDERLWQIAAMGRAEGAAPAVPHDPVNVAEVSKFKANAQRFLKEAEALATGRTRNLLKWLDTSVFLDTLEDYSQAVLADAVPFQDVIGRALYGINSSQPGTHKIDAWIKEAQASSRSNLLWRSLALNQRESTAIVDVALKLAYGPPAPLSRASWDGVKGTIQWAKLADLCKRSTYFFSHGGAAGRNQLFATLGGSHLSPLTGGALDSVNMAVLQTLMLVLSGADLETSMGLVEAELRSRAPRESAKNAQTNGAANPTADGRHKKFAELISMLMQTPGFELAMTTAMILAESISERIEDAAFDGLQHALASTLPDKAAEATKFPFATSGHEGRQAATTGAGEGATHYKAGEVSVLGVDNYDVDSTNRGARGGTARWDGSVKTVDPVTGATRSDSKITLQDSAKSLLGDTIFELEPNHVGHPDEVFHATSAAKFLVEYGANKHVETGGVYAGQNKQSTSSQLVNGMAGAGIAMEGRSPLNPTKKMGLEVSFILEAGAVERKVMSAFGVVNDPANGVYGFSLGAETRNRLAALTATWNFGLDLGFAGGKLSTQKFKPRGNVFGKGGTASAAWTDTTGTLTFQATSGGGFGVMRYPKNIDVSGEIQVPSFAGGVEKARQHIRSWIPPSIAQSRRPEAVPAACTSAGFALIVKGLTCGQPVTDPHDPALSPSSKHRH